MAVTFFLLLAIAVLVGQSVAVVDKDLTLLDELNNLLSKDLQKKDALTATFKDLEEFLIKKKDKLENIQKKDDKESDAKETKKKTVDVQSDLTELLNLVKEDGKTEKKETQDAKTETNDKSTGGQTKKDFLTDMDTLVDITKEAPLKRDASVSQEIKLEEDFLFNDEQVEKPEEKTKCIDAKGLRYCYKKAFDNACHTHPKEMEKDCARSCRFCCDDDKSIFGLNRCKKYKGMSLCGKEDYQDKLRIVCPKTCGICGRAPAEKPCVRTKYGCCWDGSIAKHHVGTTHDSCPACEDKNGQKFCLLFQDRCDDNWSVSGAQIRRICPKTCRRCGAHAKCRDDPSMKDSCRQQLINGACEIESNFHAMKYSCAKTCKLCHETTIDCENTQYGCCADGMTIAKGYFKEGCKECEDVISSSFDCDFLKKHDACHLDKKRMGYLCPATCGFCASG